MKKAVLFDLDGTILDFEKSEETALKKTFLRHGIPLTEEQVLLYKSINRKWWKMLAEKKVSKEEVVVARFEEFLGEIGSLLDPEEVAKSTLSSSRRRRTFFPVQRIS